MNLSLMQSPVEATARVLSLCRRSGLAPAELAAILAEIPDDAVSQYRSYLLAEVWPNIFTAYLSGGYHACAEPHVRPQLARAYLASYCHATGVKPSLLADAAAAYAPHWNETPMAASSHAAAMLHEMADHIS
ncbi:MAG: hypothetical protein U0X20_24705 [Caldilineaceae bacterium]